MLEHNSFGNKSAGFPLEDASNCGFHDDRLRNTVSGTFR
jgi:hypothetical protein